MHICGGPLEGELQAWLLYGAGFTDGAGSRDVRDVLVRPWKHVRGSTSTRRILGPIVRFVILGGRGIVLV